MIRITGVCEAFPASRARPRAAEPPRRLPGAVLPCATAREVASRRRLEAQSCARAPCAAEESHASEMIPTARRLRS
eukprot:3986234-Prymnesium_polylepis.1